MLHVFVETNWVVDYASPAHYRVPAAVRLLERARSGELRLHLPAICLQEAKRPIRAKHQSRHCQTVRQFLNWANAGELVSQSDAEIVRRVLDLLEQRVRADLAELDNALASLTSEPGFEVFPLNEAMLQKTTEFSLSKLDLQPFDQAILAAVLVHSLALRGLGAVDLAFCELDADLQPWDKQGKPKDPLTGLYDHAGVWVYGDFELRFPPRPDGWAARPNTLPPPTALPTP